MPQILWNALLLLAGEPHQLLFCRRVPSVLIATPRKLALLARQAGFVDGMGLCPQLIHVFLQISKLHLVNNHRPEAPIARVVLKVLAVVHRGDENTLARHHRLVIAVLLHVLVGVLREELLDSLALGTAHGPELLELHNPLALEQHGRLFRGKIEAGVEMPLPVHAQDAGRA